MASEKNITMRQYNGVDYDTLYPKTIAEQVIGIYSKDEILSNATKTIYGLGSDAVPDDVLSLLKTLVSNAQTSADGKSSIELVSYVGTGTSGPSNPTSMTFSVAPDFFMFLGYKQEGTFYDSHAFYVNTKGTITASTSGGSISSWMTDILPTSYASGTGPRMKKSQDGKTISWYHQYSDGSGTSAISQRNHSGIEYCYIGFSC